MAVNLQTVFSPELAQGRVIETFLGNSFICPTRSGTTEIYIFGPAGAGIQNKICNIHLIDIVLQVQKYFEVQVFLVLQKYLEYQK